MTSLDPSFETIAAWIGAPVPDADATTWELVPAGGSRLPVVLRWDPVARREGGSCTVCFAPWTHAVDEDEIGDALLDLVAAGLFGRCRQRLAVREGRVEHGVLEFHGPVGWSVHARWGRRRWWARYDTRELRNALAAPFPLAAGSGWSRAPWTGLASAVHADAAAPVAVPVDGELDLHTYAPAQVAGVVEAYLEACRTRGVLHVRVVHGKGRGQLRRTVHAVLARNAAVRSFRLGSMGEGSWGATLVELRPLGDDAPKIGVSSRRS